MINGNGGLRIKRLILTGYGLILSTVIGLIASLFLIVESTLGAWFTAGPRWLQLGALILGSGLLYGTLHRWPSMPETAHTAMVGLKRHQLGPYHLVFVNLWVTLIILSLGAGVGPEAALLSAIIGLSSWQADKIRYLYFNYAQLATLPKRQVLRRLCSFNQYQQRYDEALAVKQPRQLWQKRLLMSLFTVNGLVAFSILMRQTDQPSFVTKLGQSAWHGRDLLAILPLILIAGAYGLVWRWLGQRWQHGLTRLTLPLGVKIGLGALGIWLVLQLQPDLLFSGQHSVHLLVGAWQQRSPWFLTAMAAGKLLFLGWCLQLRWRGGDIFPVLFASFAQGFAVSGWLSGFDQLVVVAVTATAMAGCLLDSPVLAGIMVLLFCPLNLSPVIVATTLILMVGKRGWSAWQSRRQKPMLSTKQPER